MMTETDAEMWIVNGSGTVARIEIASQSATEIGIDGEIENVRLVRLDVTATAVIANRVALYRISNLTHTLFLLTQTERINLPCTVAISCHSHIDAIHRISRSAVSFKRTQ